MPDSPSTADRSTDATVTTKLSPRSVTDTIARLESVLTEKGLKLFAVVDHSGEARAVGLDLRDTKVVIFGSPQAGTPVMQAVPLAAIDLPLKVLVWADGDQTKVSYTAPRALATISDALGRQALHAAVLELDQPTTGARLRFESPLPADLVAARDALRALTRSST